MIPITSVTSRYVYDMEAYKSIENILVKKGIINAQDAEAIRVNATKSGIVCGADRTLGIPEFVMQYIYYYLTGKKVLIRATTITKDTPFDYALYKNVILIKSIKQENADSQVILLQRHDNREPFNPDIIEKEMSDMGIIHNADISKAAKESVKYTEAVCWYEDNLINIGKKGFTQEEPDMKLTLALFYQANKELWYKAGDIESEAFARLVDALYKDGLTRDKEYSRNFVENFKLNIEIFDFLMIDEKEVIMDYFKSNIAKEAEEVKNRVSDYDKEIKNARHILLTRIQQKETYVLEHQYILNKENEADKKAETIIEAISVNPYINSVNIINGTLQLHIIRPLTISDLNELNKRIKNEAIIFEDKDAEELIIKSFTEGSGIELINEILIRVRLTSSEYEAVKNVEEYAGKLYRHPHLYYHNCFGSYESTLTELIQTKNFLGLFEQLTEVPSEINVFDSVVLEEFKEDVNDEGGSEYDFKNLKTFRNTETGEMFSLEDYKKMKEETNDEAPKNV